MTIAPTGTQYEIRHGDLVAVITEQGATLRSLTAAGEPLITSFGDDRLPVNCQGQQLFPWANRIRDGRYSFAGQDYQAPINEVDRNNAIHGLVRWLPFAVVRHEDDVLMQSLRLLASDAHPGSFELTITHRLGEQGLTVSVEAENLGPASVPFGYAAHPYVTVGGSIDTWTVTHPMDAVVLTDERLLPIQVAPVAGTDHDFSGGALLGDRVLDNAFVQQHPAAWRLTVAGPERSLTVWGDEHIPALQLFTPTDRLSLAVEPATCATDTLNPGPTHEWLLVLEPAQRWAASWGIRPGR